MTTSGNWLSTHSAQTSSSRRGNIAQKTAITKINNSYKKIAWYFRRNIE